MKKQVIAATCLAGMVLGGVQSAFAVERISDTEVNTKVNAKVILDGVPEVPGPGPTDPTDPPETLPSDVLYGINYVSNLDFGSIDFSETNQTLKTQWDADLFGEIEPEEPEEPSTFAADDEGRIYSYLSIRDFREDGEREGWAVTVARDSENFIRGGILTLNPSFSVAGSTGTATSTNFVLPANLEVNDAPTNIVVAENAITGHAGFVLGEASLEVPAYTAGGEYTTTLTWNLTAGPA